jgi:hypothetical protein
MAVLAVQCTVVRLCCYLRDALSAVLLAWRMAQVLWCVGRVWMLLLTFGGAKRQQECPARHNSGGIPYPNTLYTAVVLLLRTKRGKTRDTL